MFILLIREEVLRVISFIHCRSPRMISKLQGILTHFISKLFIISTLTSLPRKLYAVCVWLPWILFCVYVWYPFPFLSVVLYKVIYFESFPFLWKTACAAFWLHFLCVPRFFSLYIFTCSFTLRGFFIIVFKISLEYLLVSVECW